MLNVTNVFIAAEEIMDNMQDEQCDVLVESDNEKVTKTVNTMEGKTYDDVLVNFDNENVTSGRKNV